MSGRVEGLRFTVQGLGGLGRVTDKMLPKTVHATKP